MCRKYLAYVTLYLHKNTLVYFHSTFWNEGLAYEDVYMVREHKLYVPEKNSIKKEVPTKKKYALLKSYKLDQSKPQIWLQASGSHQVEGILHRNKLFYWK